MSPHLIKLRDELVDAFADLQTTSNLRSWLPADATTIHNNVLDTAQSICKRLGDDWKSPTCLSLIRLIARLVTKAHQWGANRVELDRWTTELGKKMDAALEEGS